MVTVLNVKIEEKLKKEAQETARALGLPLSTVVAAGLRDFVRTQSITFSAAPKLKPTVEAELIKISADAKNDKNISPAFNDLDDAFAWLNSDE